MIRAMPDPIPSSTSNAADRAEVLVQVRAELRDNHPRLTERQIELIADVAVDLRLTQARLGLSPGPSLPPPPVRIRVPALAGPA
jgi:hypothetical protein